MQFKTDAPQPPKEVTVTFTFDELATVMRLIGNSDRVNAVDKLQWVTERQFNRLQEIFDTFFTSNYYNFYRLWHD